MQKFRDVVQDRSGNAVVGAQVLVQTYPGAVDATIYSDDGVTPAVNPLQTGSNGEFEFYAADGSYQLVVSGTGITTRTITDLRLEDPSDASEEIFTDIVVSGSASVAGAITAASVAATTISATTLSVSGAITAASLALSGTLSAAAISGTNISASGQFRAADGSAAAPSYSFTNEINSGLFKAGSATIGFSVAGVERFRFTGSASVGFTIHQSHPLSWGSSGATTPDLFVWRDAANGLAQRNGTNAQSFRIYNTFTDTSNYERVALEFSANTFNVRTQAAGTGTVRDLRLATTGAANVLFNANGVDEWAVIQGGNLRPPSARDNSNDLGSPTARVRTGFFTNLDSGAASSISIKTNNGTTQFAVSHTASAVNFLQVTGSAAGGSAGISAQGADTNVGINFAAKAAGGFRFMTNGFNDEQFRINANASAVNYLAVSGGIVSNWPSIVANGADTNIGILIRSKGSSPIEFDTNGSTQQFRVAHIASAVNYLQATGAATGNKAELSAQGSDTDVGVRLISKGTGEINLNTSGGVQLCITHAASAVNYVQVQGAAAGAGPVISAQGADTDIQLRIASKGANSIDFRSGGGRQFLVAHVASTVNYFQVQGSGTGSEVPVGAQGSDTNIPLSLYSKGISPVNVKTNGNANIQLSVQHTASAVNFAQITGSTTGNGIVYGAGGSDTNISVNYNTKGSGQHNLTTGGGNQFTVKHTASAVNNLSITGAAASGIPTLSAEGSDSNVHVNLYAKAAGQVHIGSTTQGAGFTVSTVASSVNRLIAKGAATGNPAALAAFSGSDTNVDISLEPQGTGKVKGTLDVLAVACSDETTALTTGTAKVTFRMPYAMTLYSVKASLTTAQTSGSIFTVDINESGTTILSTKLTIDNTEKTSATAATAAVISDTALASDAEITVDIDQIGDGTAKGLKVYLIGKITG